MCACDLLWAHEETVLTSLALSLVELLPTSRQSPCSHHFAISCLAMPSKLADIYIYIYTCAWIHAFSSYVFLAFNGIYTQELKKLHIIPLLVARMLETCVERGRLSMTGDEEEAQLRRKRWERLRDGATHRSQTLASKQTHKACPLLVPAFVDSVVPLFHFNVLGSVLDVSNPWNETLIWSVDQLQIITHFMTWSSRYVRRNAIIFFCKCTIHRKLLINHNEKNSSMSKVKI